MFTIMAQSGKYLSDKKTTKYSDSKECSTETVAQYLKGIVCLTVEQGLGKTRASILTKQLLRHGGISSRKLDDFTTHILVGNSIKLEKLLRILKVDESELRDDVEVVRGDWLSLCLKEGKLVDLSPIFSLRAATLCASGKKEECSAVTTPVSFNIDKPTTSECVEFNDCSISKQTKDEIHEIKAGRKRNREARTDESSDSDYINSEDEKSDEELYSCSGNDVQERLSEIAPHISPHKKGNATWVCTKPSSSRQENVNQHITEKLEILEKVYKNTNDHWRALGYKKAISSIKNHPKKIKTLEECQSLPFVGERLANKMWEIVQTGHLQRLEHLDSKTNSIDLFCNLWGAGPKTAENWVAKGLTTLDDLKEHGDLNRQQLIGLKHYDEFLDRMPRTEAEEIGKVVTEATQFINPGLCSVVCGSFRRGKTTCGDVDVLVSHPDGCSHQDVMPQLLKRLKETNFLTDDLTLMDNQNQRKYLGVCILPGDNRKHRRIDIIVVPYSEWSCALVYFTGSDYLNRSMRLLARKKGMSLSEHSLNTGVVRKGQERLAEGTPLPVSCERDIFGYLGLDYLEPCERDW